MTSKLKKELGEQSCSEQPHRQNIIPPQNKQRANPHQGNFSLYQGTITESHSQSSGELWSQSQELHLIYNMTPIPQAQGTLKKRGWRDINSRGPSCEVESHQLGCPNRS